MSSSSCSSSSPFIGAPARRAVARARSERPRPREASTTSSRWGRSRRSATATAAHTISCSGHPTWSGATSSCGCSRARRCRSRWGSCRRWSASSSGSCWGCSAGFYGGVTDTLVSRLTEIVMAFPLLLFLIAISATVGDRLERHHVRRPAQPGRVHAHDGDRALHVVLPGPDRPRAGAVAAREGVRRGGAHGRVEQLPHHALAPPAAPGGTIIVYGTLTVAINILLESTLSFLGVGLPPPNASWGNMLDEASGLYTIQPWLIVWPGVALLILTLAFNLLGDGLRDALDPRGDALDRFLTFGSLPASYRGVLQGQRGGRVPARKRLGRTRMRRRPGLWLTLGALAAGVVLLGAAGCGGSDNGGGKRRKRRGHERHPGRTRTAARSRSRSPATSTTSTRRWPTTSRPGRSSTRRASS